MNNNNNTNVNLESLNKITVYKMKYDFKKKGLIKLINKYLKKNNYVKEVVNKETLYKLEENNGQTKYIKYKATKDTLYMSAWINDGKNNISIEKTKDKNFINFINNLTKKIKKRNKQTENYKNKKKETTVNRNQARSGISPSSIASGIAINTQSYNNTNNNQKDSVPITGTPINVFSGNDETQSVNTNEMHNFSNALSTIINNLDDYITEISENMKLLDASIKNLNDYNGQLSDSTAVDTNGQEIKYSWAINTASQALLTNFLLKIEIAKVAKLNNFNIDIKNDTTIIEGFIQNIKNVLGVSLDDNFNSQTLNNYLKDYNTTMDNFMNFTEIVNDEGDFRIQGITLIDGKYFITACDHDKEMNSRIYVYGDDHNFLGKIILNSNAHVGGISYDPSNGLLYITDKNDENGNGKIDIYDFSLLNLSLNDCREKDENNVILDLTQDPYIQNSALLTVETLGAGAASTVYGYQNQVFIGTYDENKNGVMVSYNIEKGPDGSVQALNRQEYEIPKFTQGIAVTESNGKKYLITTQSKSYDNSVLQIHEMGENGELTEVGKVQINNSGAEGIAITDNPDGSKNVTISYENVKGKGEIEGTTFDNYYNRSTTLNSTCDFDELLTIVSNAPELGENGNLCQLNMETMQLSEGINLDIVNI